MLLVTNITLLGNIKLIKMNSTMILVINIRHLLLKCVYSL